MKRQLESLNRIACNESYELDARYAVARQMVAIRKLEKPEKDIPAGIIRGLGFRQQPKKAARS